MTFEYLEKYQSRRKSSKEMPIAETCQVEMSLEGFTIEGVGFA